MKKIFLLIILFLLISSFLFSQEKPRILVLNLKPINVASFLSEAVSDNIFSMMPKYTDFQLISKSEALRIYKELKITDPNRIDDDVAIDIAKKANAKLLLTGSLSQVGFKLFLNTRIIDVEKEIVVYSNSFDTTNKNQIWDYVEPLLKDIAESRLDIIENIVKKENIAVLNFNTVKSGLNKDVSINFTNYINTFLKKYRYYKIIETNEVNKALTELGFDKKESLSEDDIKKIGEKLDVKLILFGDISKKDDYYIYSAKAMDVEKGIVVLGRNYSSRSLIHLKEIGDRIAVVLSSDAIMEVKSDIINVEKEEYSFHLNKSKKLFTAFLAAGLPLALTGLGSGITGAALFGVYTYRNNNLSNVSDDGTYYDQNSQMYLASIILLGVICPIFIIPGAVLSFMSIGYYIKYKRNKAKFNEITYSPIIEFEEDKVSMGLKFKF